jgi:biopolymer transport protein ExbD
MRFPRNKQIFRGQLDVAAFAGMLFILLVFILLRSQLVFTPGVPIRLPVAEELPGVIGPRLVVVSVDATGQFYFENQITHDRLLRSRLSNLAAEAPEPLWLIVQADVAVSYGRVMELISLARLAGVKFGACATRPPPTPAARAPALSPP